MPLKDVLAEARRAHTFSLIVRSDGNVAAMARAEGTTRWAIHQRIRACGLRAVLDMTREEARRGES